MTDKKFKVGEPVIVTTKFDSSGRLSWEPEMDEYIGKTGKITCIDEDGDVRLDGKWFFYPRVLEHVKKTTSRPHPDRKSHHRWRAMQEDPGIRMHSVAG